jgi:hypothetical protein
MQRFAIEGDRATYRFRPMDFPGGCFIFAGLACALMNSMPVLRQANDWSEIVLLPTHGFVIANLLLALVGLVGYCIVSTVVIDKKSGDITQRHEIVPPLGLPVWRLFGHDYKLSDLNCVELDRTVARRRSPTLSLSGANTGVQLLGTWFSSDEMEKIGLATAQWLGFELKGKS